LLAQASPDYRRRCADQSLGADGKGARVDPTTKTTDTSDGSNGTAHRCSCNRTGDGLLSTDFRHYIDSLAVGHAQYFVLPLRVCTVIDCLVGPKATSALQFLISG